MNSEFSGAKVRQAFIDYFLDKGHTYVHSTSLVPGGDQTLLFTNAGMVQFKDVFLGTDKPPYTRAVNSQKCMRVAGKHNDLEDVGRDDTHHTFFEMLGNWSFGDYYKKEAIEWAWDLLTNVWGLPKERLYATCFQDELGEIPTDEEAANYWSQQPGFDPDHVFFLGRKDNFWEMADTGPCGPNSEILIDLKPNLGTVKLEDLDMDRFTELWNLVFIQYNRSGPTQLEPLPAKHVDTGMGFERIVAVLQGVNSTYRTDLLWPLILTTQKLCGHTEKQREENITPYRVIADHARAASFLIADGVVPGNLGRNYITRMIIRRAYRFGNILSLQEPFLADVAGVVIENLGGFFPELRRNQAAILSAITREEQQFQRTLDKASAHLNGLLDELASRGGKVLSGDLSADLYTTYGMPLEITRDIAQERGLEVDESGFNQMMEQHRRISGSGKALGTTGGEDVDLYLELKSSLQNQGLLPPDGVIYNPYGTLEFESDVLALVQDGRPVDQANPGDLVEVLLPETHFYVEAGGQVSDTGVIRATKLPGWEIEIKDIRKPAAGIIVHVGEVLHGHPKVGDQAIAAVDTQRRRDIMRNHTATHLLHSALRVVLGEHVRQAGSLVAPERLRFDFTHSEALTPEQLQRIESIANQDILNNYTLQIRFKPLQLAIQEGAMALFGEKYADTVRTITIGDETPLSYELCGGTHVSETGDIGMCLIIGEGSVAAGIRRIEAVTGRGAYELVQRHFRTLKETASMLNAGIEEVPQKIHTLLKELTTVRKQASMLRRNLSDMEFIRHLEDIQTVKGIPVLTATLPGADEETLRQFADRFRQQYTNGVAVLASVIDGRPVLVASVTQDLIPRGLHAGELVKFVAGPLGGGGGGRPTLAQAGGKDATRLDESLSKVYRWVEENLQPIN